MTPNQFHAWRTRHGWSQTEAGVRIGLGRDAVAKIEAGTSPCTKRTALACAAASLGIVDYDGREKIVIVTGR